MNAPFAGAGIAILGPFPPRPGGVSVQCAILADELAAAGAHVTRINTDLPGLRGRGLAGRALLPPAQTLAVLARIWRTRAAWQVLHAHAASWWGFLPAVAGLAARALGKRLVVSYHGGEAAAFMARFGWLAGPALRRAHALLALTATQARLFAAHGLRPALAPNIVPIAAFPFRLREMPQPRLLWLRQMEPRYRPHDALAIFARVQAQHPAATLTMAGGGSLLAELKQAAAQQKLGGVAFTGHLQPAQIPAAYAAADLFLNTSAIDNLPLTLIEAAASGLAIVSTDAGAIPDLIDHGQNGLLAPVGDIEALAGHCLSLLAEPEQARTLSLAGRDLAQRFAWPRIAPLLAAAYGLM